MLLVHKIHPAFYWLPLLKCIMIQALRCDTMLLAHMQDLIRSSLPSCQVLLEHSCQPYLECTCTAKKEMIVANKISQQSIILEGELGTRLCQGRATQSMSLLVFWSLVGKGISGYALKGCLHIGSLLGTGVKVGNVALAGAPLLCLLVLNLQHTEQV